jgi:alpha-tubulin N-acetyltransferase 1
MVQADPLCVLDFYTHCSCQRKGLGRMIFQSMLETENVNPGELAYDRPSDKLPPFLQRHFGLQDGVLQPNRYMIYPHKFFNSSRTTSTS